MQVQLSVSRQTTISRMAVTWPKDWTVDTGIRKGRVGNVTIKQRQGHQELGYGALTESKWGQI